MSKYRFLYGYFLIKMGSNQLRRTYRQVYMAFVPFYDRSGGGHFLNGYHRFAYFFNHSRILLD